MIWVSSISLGVIIIGLTTLGFCGVKIPKTLATPTIIAGFFLTLGFLLSWIGGGATISSRSAEPLLTNRTGIHLLRHVARRGHFTEFVERFFALWNRINVRVRFRVLHSMLF